MSLEIDIFNEQLNYHLEGVKSYRMEWKEKKKTTLCRQSTACSFH